MPSRGAARAWSLGAVALGIPLAWAMLPYGRRMGDFEPQTFLTTTLILVREVTEDQRGLTTEAVTIAPPVLLGLLAPLYPALGAVVLLAAPRWMARRPRWLWIAIGAALIPLSILGGLYAWYALAVIVFGAARGPVLYPPLWLLPGLAVAASVAAIAVGVAPTGALARFLLARRGGALLR